MIHQGDGTALQPDASTVCVLLHCMDVPLHKFISLTESGDWVLRILLCVLVAYDILCVVWQLLFDCEVTPRKALCILLVVVSVWG